MPRRNNFNEGEERGLPAPFLIMATPAGIFPKNLRIFLNGFEVTSLVKKFKLESNVDDLPHLNLLLVSGSCKLVNDNEVHFGNLPEDDFLAELVRLKFRRDGVIKDDE